MTENVDMGVNAYLDGELGPEEAAEIETQLDVDPEARAQFDAFLLQKAQISEAADALDAKPWNLETARLERRLATAIHMRSTPRKVIAFGAWSRMGSQLAATCAFVAFGWWGHATWSVQASGVPEYVAEAVGAHLVFAEDMLHPVEFSGGAINGATKWFSEKVGVSINAPDLSGQGMFLIGSRLLGTKEGPLAQFIYEDINGGRVSLTLRRHLVNQPILPFQVTKYPNRTVGFWSTPDVDYALVGNDNVTLIHTLAQSMGASE
ncbi:anti-sigma factor family protein [Sulfitobacter sp.]|uniref:anti-sigma factor family protein n=1 Tax=Sulfitobacter sp. TaxID=1903071 RepID=UPI0030010C56